MSVELRKEQTIAVFVDFENLALGVEEDKKGRFEIELVLKRLLERGRIVFKRAYCDWTRFQNFMREFHMHGFEMVDIPRSSVSARRASCALRFARPTTTSRSTRSSSTCSRTARAATRTR